MLLNYCVSFTEIPYIYIYIHDWLACIMCSILNIFKIPQLVPQIILKSLPLRVPSFFQFEVGKGRPTPVSQYSTRKPYREYRNLGKHKIPHAVLAINLSVTVFGRITWLRYLNRFAHETCSEVSSVSRAVFLWCVESVLGRCGGSLIYVGGENVGVVTKGINNRTEDGGQGQILINDSFLKLFMFFFWFLCQQGHRHTKTLKAP